MKTNYNVLFNGVITVLFLLLIISVPYKGQSLLTRLTKGAAVLNG